MNRHSGRLLVPFALVSLSALGVARPPGGGEGSDWLDLDREIEALAGSVLPGDPVVDVSLLVRAFYAVSEDSILGASSRDSLSGMTLIDGDFAVDATASHARGRVSFDLSNPSDMLEDAWAQWRSSERFAVRAGQFKPRVTFSNHVDPELLLFQDRTYLGSFFDFWDTGVELSGRYDQFDWYVAVSNGTSGLGSDHAYVFRGEWALYDAAWKPQEGARGAPRHLRMMLGATHFKESNTPGFQDADGTGLDFALTLGPYALGQEFYWFGDGVGGPTKGNGVPAITFSGDSNPWDFTFSRMFGDTWQAAYRFQHPDDANRTTVRGFALHHYPEKGPVAIVGEFVEHDANRGPEGWVVRLGISVGRTRR